MKKIFALFLLFLLAGAGCMGGNQKEDKDLVSGDWWLTFDLPADWAMYVHYDEEVPVPGGEAVTRELGDVVIQSTTLPIILEGDEAGETVTDFVEEDYSYARVFRYDPRTSVPSDVEDLGNGFFKQTRDGGETVYYFDGVNGKYKFVIEQEDQDLSVIEEVILSAQEVTDLE